MTKRTTSPLLALLLAGLFTLPTAPEQQQPQPQLSHTFLKVGDVAPDFTLRSDQGATLKLSDYRGKQNVILAFYVLGPTRRRKDPALYLLATSPNISLVRRRSEVSLNPLLPSRSWSTGQQNWRNDACAGMRFGREADSHNKQAAYFPDVSQPVRDP